MRGRVRADKDPTTKVNFTTFEYQINKKLFYKSLKNLHLKLRRKKWFSFSVQLMKNLTSKTKQIKIVKSQEINSNFH